MIKQQLSQNSLFRIKHDVLATKCTCACGSIHSDASRFLVIYGPGRVCMIYSLHLFTTSCQFIESENRFE